MKTTIFTALIILILQVTSIINIGNMYTQITNRYGSNFENLMPQVDHSLFNEEPKRKTLDVRF